MKQGILKTLKKVRHTPHSPMFGWEDALKRHQSASVRLARTRKSTGLLKQVAWHSKKLPPEGICSVHALTHTQSAHTHIIYKQAKKRGKELQ